MRILRYLWGTLQFGLDYYHVNNPLLTCYTNDNQARCKDCYDLPLAIILTWVLPQFPGAIKSSLMSLYLLLELSTKSLLVQLLGLSSLEGFLKLLYSSVIIRIFLNRPRILCPILGQSTLRFTITSSRSMFRMVRQIWSTS